MLSNEEYYGLVEAGKTLCHHGVRWQAWGVQNGPPYPLGSAGKARAKVARHILGGRKAREERLAEKADSKATMASINRKLVASKLQNANDKAGYKIRKAENKAAISKARHTGKHAEREAKTRDQLEKLRNQQELAKQKASLKDARHKGSIEFRLKQDQLIRQQYKNEMAKLKAERDRVTNKAAKDAVKARLKAEKQAARDRLSTQKADRKNQLKMEKERLKMQEREKIRQEKADQKQKAHEEKMQQKAERKAEAKANSPLQQMKDRIVNSGDPKMLKKYGRILNNDEYKSAVDRIKQVNELKSAKVQKWVDRGKQLSDTMSNVANTTTKGIETINNGIKILNFLRGPGREPIRTIGDMSGKQNSSNNSQPQKPSNSSPVKNAIQQVANQAQPKTQTNANAQKNYTPLASKIANANSKSTIRKVNASVKDIQKYRNQLDKAIKNNDERKTKDLMKKIQSNLDYINNTAPWLRGKK